MIEDADYLISGVWFHLDEKTQVIGYVMVHVNDKTYKDGSKTPVEYLINYMKAGRKVKAIQWDYKQGNWAPGVAVFLVEKEGTYFLMADEDAGPGHELENLLNMGLFEGHDV